MCQRKHFPGNFSCLCSTLETIGNLNEANNNNAWYGRWEIFHACGCGSNCLEDCVWIVCVRIASDSWKWYVTRMTCSRSSWSVRCRIISVFQHHKRLQWIFCGLRIGSSSKKTSAARKLVNTIWVDFVCLELWIAISTSRGPKKKCKLKPNPI